MDEVIWVSEFSLSNFDLGTKKRVWLSITPRAGGGSWCLPVLVICGSRPGPRLTVLGGIHGDEYDGPEVIHKLFGSLSAVDLRGTLHTGTMTNVPRRSTADKLPNSL